MVFLADFYQSYPYLINTIGVGVMTVIFICLRSRLERDGGNDEELSSQVNADHSIRIHSWSFDAPPIRRRTAGQRRKL
ncbi:uncharacterized protein N7459_009362 [Penicillium hispanicum]|uniref:uncharacterized protein n=1 Tax=Penicillium hispanicum TaxID=1080232 RepID=UPI00254000D6|nr:uncharacterized protein N7459_009362 [Penicillium hispanicum]KAJ5569932.1 hypothetical protein N7459_009362 [Penicillium hispanicum]